MIRARARVISRVALKFVNQPTQRTRPQPEIEVMSIALAQIPTLML
jgi:hypothetical protein